MKSASFKADRLSNQNTVSYAEFHVDQALLEMLVPDCTDDVTSVLISLIIVPDGCDWFQDLCGVPVHLVVAPGHLSSPLPFFSD